MIKDRLEILKREFNLFEWKVNELERLKRILYSLNTQGFEEDFVIIKEKLSNIEDIAEIGRLIYNLKLKIREKRIKSAFRVAELIERIFECNEKIDVWGYEKIREEYEYILKEYRELPEEEKMFVYNILIRSYKKIKEKNES